MFNKGELKGTKRIGNHIRVDLYDRLMAFAVSRRCSVRQVLEAAIEEFLEKYERCERRE